MTPANDARFRELIKDATWLAGGRGLFSLSDFLFAVQREFKIPERPFFHGKGDRIDARQWAYQALMEKSFLCSRDGFWYELVAKSKSKR